jgi:hypothetical protein
LHNESSVYAAVDRLNATVTEARDLEIPFWLMRKNKYPSWFSGKLKFYIRKNNYFIDNLRIPRLSIFTINFLSTVNL